MSSEKNIILQVIDMYKNRPHLWDKFHPEYNNKTARANASNELLNVYRKFDPDATLKTMSKKIQNLRTNYFKQVQRLKAFRKSGITKRGLSEPTLWYFHALKFLGETGLNHKSEWAPTNIEILSSTDDEKSYESAEIFATPPTTKQIVTSTVSQNTSDDNDSVDLVPQVINKEWEIMGRSIGLQLQDLDTKQLAITQKIIAEAIYYAKFGLLTENSHVSLTAEPHPP